MSKEMMGSNLDDYNNNNNNRNIMVEDDTLFSFAMNLSTMSTLPMVLKVVIELDVLEIIKRAGPGAFLSPAQIAAQMHTKNPNSGTVLDRMLRVLASYSILTCSTQTIFGPNGPIERRYGLGHVCKFLTKDEDGVTLGPLLLLDQDKIFMDSMYHLKDAVFKNNSPFNEAHGMDVFEYLGKDQRLNKIFNEGMEYHSTFTFKKILENYKGFEGISTLVDIGGGNGASLGLITSRYPTIRGINFDLPHVLANAPSFKGVEHVAGDMFASVPKGDGMLMKWISHSWSDEHCKILFKNCYVALPNHGKVIVCEYIVPMLPESSYAARTALHYDVIMMTSCLGGKERTEQEFEALAKGAGFEGFRVACSAYDMKVMEFLKKNASF